jgi:methylase of polypeptide subunit release factors
MSDRPDLKQALGRLLGPAAPEIGCDECFDRLDRYVELELAGHDADTAVPGCGLTSTAAPHAARNTRACARSSAANRRSSKKAAARDTKRVVGETTFYGLRLATAPGQVMTPRTASEQLVTLAAERIGRRAARVADVGTGSGAIAVALALAAPKAEIWATDISAESVLLARANAHLLGVGDRVHVARGDLLEPVPGDLDLIVANLPYLPCDASESHPDLAAEPADAVFTTGDGLGPYRRLLADAAEKLRPAGAVAIQLHRRVFMAERDAVSALRATLPAVA